MNFDVDIDQIVREVLARLRDGDADNNYAGSSGPGVSGGRATRAANPVAATSPANDGAAAAAGRLVLTERLVTLATLENRLTGIRHVVLPRGAVVTPSARDVLVDKRIGTSYAAMLPAARSPAPALVVGIAGLGSADRATAHTFDRSAFQAALSRDGVSVERIADTGLASVVAELVDHAARGGRPVLLLTREAAAAVVCANRSSGVRAIAVQDAAELRRATASTGANFLVLDPTAAPAEAPRIVAEFVKSFPAPVPPLFAEKEKGVRNLFHRAR